MSVLKYFLRKVKKSLYFFVAAYFGFFARIVLKRWKPRIITVIGSSGKTTLLHLLESQFGAEAVYSHKANSAFGIPFHILDLERKTFSPIEWLWLGLVAPFKTFRKLPAQKLYVTEADAERPGEAHFLAELLRPEVLVWLSLGETHGANFDRLVTGQPGSMRVEEEIAREFGHFPKHTSGLVIYRADNQFIVRECEQAAKERKMKRHEGQQKISLHSADVQGVRVERDSVVFETVEGEMHVPRLVPPDVGLSTLAVAEVASYFAHPFDPNFPGFTLPPSRSSVFEGIKNTTLIDSTYNATIEGMQTMLALFEKYSTSTSLVGPSPAGGGQKWLVLGDMIEQGKSERAEHELLADLIAKTGADRAVLVGPRLKQYTAPKLAAMSTAKNTDSETVFVCEKPGEALDYLLKNLVGDETILFKGARFLEGVVEKLLANPADASKLCRREKVWVERRKQWGI